MTKSSVSANQGSHIQIRIFDSVEKYKFEYLIVSNILMSKKIGIFETASHRNIRAIDRASG